MDSETIAHHSLHLVVLVEDGREVHADVLWPQERTLPHPESVLRFYPGMVLHVVEVVVNCFPEREGSWGDLVIGARVMADRTLVPLTLESIEQMLTDRGVKHYRGGHYGK